MTKAELKKQINQTASRLKKDYKAHQQIDNKPAVDISHHSLYIAFNLGKGYYFQGEEAQQLWDEANELSDKSGASVENCLLFLSDSWG